MRLFRELAGRYFSLERSMTGLGQDVHALSALLRERGVKRLLDAGCGSGEHAWLFGRRGFDVVGLDRSESMIRAAKERFHGGCFVHSDWDRYAPETPFDGIVCLFGSLGYRLADHRVRRSLRAFRKLLRTGGTAVLELWHSEPFARLPAGARQRSPNSRHAWRVVRGRPTVVRMDTTYLTEHGPIRDRHFLRTFRAEEIAQLARECGFLVEDISESLIVRGRTPGPDRVRLIVLLRAC